MNHPGKGVWMVKFNKLQKLAGLRWGRMTSHEILACMQAFFKRMGGGTEEKNDKGKTTWSGGPSQMHIMQQLGMFVWGG